MVLGKFQNLFLVRLYNFGGKAISYTMYKSLKVSLSEYFKLCKSLEAKNLIKQEDGFLLLTTEGTLYVLKIHDKHEKVLSMPLIFQRKRSSIDDYYVPNARLWAKTKNELIG